MSDQGASSVALSPTEPDNSRYYCHTCEAEFDNVTRRNDEVLCQNCNNGFVELIERPTYVPAGAEGFSDISSPQSSQEADDEDRQFLTSIIQEAFHRGLGLPIQVGAPSDPRLRARPGGADVHRFNATIRNTGGQPLEHILSDLLYGIGAAGFGGAEGNSPLVFLGNPGDYVWGREGLDAIVTQLLNQMDGSGPPPLSTDKIKQIPEANITKAQIDSNLQCSVCWEPFTLDERVRRLPCDHFYHSPCIEPWLALHGTCPICRKALHTGSPRVDPAASLAGGLSAAMGGAAGGGLNFGAAASLGNLASVLLGGGRTPTSRSSNTTPASQPEPSSNPSDSSGDPPSSNNASGRRFFDMDFD